MSDERVRSSSVCDFASCILASLCEFEFKLAERCFHCLRLRLWLRRLLLLHLSLLARLPPDVESFAGVIRLLNNRWFCWLDRFSLGSRSPHSHHCLGAHRRQASDLSRVANSEDTPDSR